MLGTQRTSPIDEDVLPVTEDEIEQMCHEMQSFDPVIVERMLELMR